MAQRPIDVRARAHQAVAFTAPFYAAPALGADSGGLRLHRYLDTEFIPRFLSELATGRLADPAGEDWWRADRFSPHGDDLVLRLPVHRTFYLLACELVCEQPARPALDPARIRSAGFVIRRRLGAAPPPSPGGQRATGSGTGMGLLATLRARLAPSASACPEASEPKVSKPNGSEPEVANAEVSGAVATARDRLALGAASAATAVQATLVQTGGAARWMLEAGEPLGWQRPAVAANGPQSARESDREPNREPDPDPSRRVAARRAGATSGRAPPPSRTGSLAYTGEETHPLHPVLVKDATGRPHTILYGFLPLGGQALALGNPLDAAGEEAALAAERAALSWPFGHRGRTHQGWQAADGRLVQDGRPTRACFELLELLVNRYHLGEEGRAGADPLNDDLGAAAQQLWFFERLPAPPVPPGGSFQRQASLPRFTLLDYLTDCFAAGPDNPLLNWLSTRRQAIDAAGGQPTAALLGQLPRRPADGSGVLAGFELTITCALAEEWRLLLGQRLLDQARRTGAELPVPKFRQGPDDLYQVIPFVRTLDDAGCECVTWADAAIRSVPFRVAAPFDPDASRPTLIQMPGLGDLKRGLARGAAMLVPPDTAGLLGALRLERGAGSDVVGEPPADGSPGVQMICSFSLPIITLVAMILLMIMVMVLNILFFWLPWVKICLPFPKLK